MQMEKMKVTIEGDFNKLARNFKTAAAVMEGLQRSDSISYVPVSDEVIDQMGDEWSKPMRIKAQRREDGLVDLIFETVEESAPE